MKAIDRVMRAYQSKRNLTADEASRLRAELSKFIDELMTGAPADPPPNSKEPQHGVAPRIAAAPPSNH